MRGAIAVVGLLLIGLWIALAWPEPANTPPLAARGSDHGVAALATGRLGAMSAEDSGAALPLAREGGAIEPRFSLRVQAVDAFGAPVPEAAITLRRAGAVEPFAVQIADANGLWSGPVPEGRIVVAAAAECVGRSVAFEVTPARAEIGTVVLLLGRPVVVTGLVVDDGGRGIANDVVEVADVSPGRHQSGYAGSVSSHLVRTDPSGRFVVEAMNGSRLSVARVATEDERTWGTAVDGATVLLAPRGVFRVTVRALTLNGDPVPAEMDGCAWGIRRPGIKDVDPDLPENNLQTDELAPGVFQLTIPGSVSVVRWLSAAGFAPMRIRFAAMAWPTTTQRVEARMTPLVSTWIRIDRRGLPWPLAADGSGSGFAQVFGLPASAQPDEAIATPLSRWSVAIDDDDPVEVQLPAGSEWIVYVGDGPKVRVRAGDRNVVVQPDHSLERAQVDLNVFRQDGERVERPRLLCHDPAPPSMFDGDFPCLVVAAGLGQGRTRVSLDSGQGTIVVTDPASRQTAVIGIRRDSPQQLSVVLQPPVELVVHVRCGSRAARGVEVRVTSHGEQRSEKVDGDGRAVLHVAPGAARLQVRRGSEVLVERELTLSPGRLELELPVAL